MDATGMNVYFQVPESEASFPVEEGIDLQQPILPPNPRLSRHSALYTNSRWAKNFQANDKPIYQPWSVSFPSNVLPMPTIEQPSLGSSMEDSITLPNFTSPTTIGYPSEMGMRCIVNSIIDRFPLTDKASPEIDAQSMSLFNALIRRITRRKFKLDKLLGIINRQEWGSDRDFRQLYRDIYFEVPNTFNYLRVAVEENPQIDVWGEISQGLLSERFQMVFLGCLWGSLNTVVNENADQQHDWEQCFQFVGRTDWCGFAEAVDIPGFSQNCLSWFDFKGTLDKILDEEQNRRAKQTLQKLRDAMKDNTNVTNGSSAFEEAQQVEAPCLSFDNLCLLYMMLDLMEEKPTTYSPNPMAEWFLEAKSQKERVAQIIADLGIKMYSQRPRSNITSRERKDFESKLREYIPNFMDKIPGLKHNEDHYANKRFRKLNKLMEHRKLTRSERDELDSLRQFSVIPTAERKTYTGNCSHTQYGMEYHCPQYARNQNQGGRCNGHQRNYPENSQGYRRHRVFPNENFGESSRQR